MSEHILDSNMRVIAAAMRVGDTSSEALVDEAARRHDAYGAALSAFKLWDPERARREARADDELLAAGYAAGALMGMPISLKDLYGVHGMPTFGGSPVELPERWQDEGPVTEALRNDVRITSLDLGYNKIDSSGAAAVGRGIAQNSALRNINLEFNDVSTDGGKSIAEALPNTVYPALAVGGVKGEQSVECTKFEITYK